MGQDENSSKSSSNKDSDTKRTKPNCARCRNHGLTIRLAGHKIFCRFRRCECENCIILKQRQRNMADNTALKRRITETTNHKIQPGELDYLDDDLLVTLPQTKRMKKKCDGNSSNSSISDHDSLGVPSSVGDERIPSTSKVSPLDQIPQPLPSTSNSGIDLLFTHSIEFLKHFCYSWDRLHLTLMYVILKDSKMNMEEAAKKIEDANSDILEYSRKMYQNRPELLRDFKPEYMREIKPELLRDIKPEFMTELKADLSSIKPEQYQLKSELPYPLKPELLCQIRAEQYQMKSSIPYPIKPELLYQIKPELQFPCLNIPFKSLGAPTYVDRVPVIGGIPPGYGGLPGFFSRLKIPPSHDCLPEPSTT